MEGGWTGRGRESDWSGSWAAGAGGVILARHTNGNKTANSSTREGAGQGSCCQSRDGDLKCFGRAGQMAFTLHYAHTNTH